MSKFTQPRAGFTYRVFHKAEEQEHFHCTRVHGRRIDFAMTPWSAICTQITRLRWRKFMDAIADCPDVTVTEEPTP